MALTLTSTPAANVAAFAPVIVAGSTTRNPYTAGVRQSATLNSTTNTGGLLQLNVTSSLFWLAGDTIVLTGCSNSALDGRHKIQSYSPTGTIVTTTTYTASGTGGTVTRLNEGLNVKLEIKNESAATIATLYAPVNGLTGTFSIDISKALQYELYTTFDLTEGETSVRGGYHDYDVYLYETFLSPTYTQTEVSDTNFATIAHRMTALTSGSVMLVSDFFHNGQIPVHYYTPDGSYGKVTVRFTEADGTVTNELISVYSGHAAITFNTASEWVKIAVYDGSERMTNEIYVRKIGCQSTLLYFVNRYGAYVGYEFHDYDDEQKTVKVDRYTGEAWKERTLFGIEYVQGVYQDIRDLVTSHEVYDASLVSVRVLTDSILYRSQTVAPEVTIRYDEIHLQ